MKRASLMLAPSHGAAALVGASVSAALAYGLHRWSLLSLPPSVRFAAGLSGLRAVMARPFARTHRPVRHRLIPGATAAYLKSRFVAPKIAEQVEVATQVPAETISKCLKGVSELSGFNLARCVAVFGPEFIIAILDPPPQWALDAMDATAREAKT